MTPLYVFRNLTYDANGRNPPHSLPDNVRKELDGIEGLDIRYVARNAPVVAVMVVPEDLPKLNKLESIVSISSSATKPYKKFQ